MKIAFAAMFFWLGAVMIHLASRGLEAQTPWGAFQTAISGIREQDTTAEAEGD